MSAFLGHIHYWLYDKIRLVNERENLIFTKAEAMCGATAEELREQVWQTYGAPLPDVDLSQLIDQSNIHGWLQRQITLAETREAALIKELLDVCQDAARGIITEAFAEHGVQCGIHAKSQQKYELMSAAGIYKALNDYRLNGMPCDQADVIIENTPNKFAWENQGCIQGPNWKRAGVAAPEMEDFYRVWINHFVKATNDKFNYAQTSDVNQGANSNRYEISSTN